MSGAAAPQERKTATDKGGARAARVLRRRADFEAVLRSGYRIASRNFVLRATLNSGSHARLGIIAGRKVAARAVDRNRAKRLVREAFRAAWPGLGCYDLAIQLRGDLRAEPNDVVRAELQQLLATFARRIAEGSTDSKHPTRCHSD